LNVVLDCGRHGGLIGGPLSRPSKTWRHCAGRGGRPGWPAEPVEGGAAPGQRARFRAQTA
jgi:hypothetical protein